MTIAAPRKPNKALTAQFVKTVKEPGKYFDGNGLYLVVGVNGSKAWGQRITVQGKRSEFGLGTLEMVSLAEARDRAFNNRKVAVDGGDPRQRKRELARTVGLTLSQALEAYWVLAADKTQGKSDDQIRRWRNPRMKAFKNFIGVVGDANIKDLSANDFLDFREWWWQKLTDENLTPNSANKDFTHIGSTFRLVCRAKRLPVPQGLTGLNFAQGEQNTRVPFSEAWIKDVILAPGALDGLNPEARAILLGCVNTGYRPSEAQGLLREHIILDNEFPHILIEPVGRTLKNNPSRRLLPLVGVSLEAFKGFPDGFPRYRGSAGLSATINKFMRENGLMETPKHTLYGLRHSIEDRMLDRDIDDRIRRDVLGHSLGRERYGKGASLETRCQMMTALRRIAPMQIAVTCRPQQRPPLKSSRLRRTGLFPRPASCAPNCPHRPPYHCRKSLARSGRHGLRRPLPPNPPRLTMWWLSITSGPVSAPTKR